MKCKHIQSRLNQYAEGGLPFLQALRIKHHLNHCPACARELNEYRQSMELMQKSFDHAKPEPLESSIWDDIVYQLPESHATATSTRDSRLETRDWRRFTPSLVAFALLIIVLWQADMKRQPVSRPMAVQSSPVELPLLEGPPPENTTVMTFECAESNTRIVWFFKNDNKS